MSMQWEDDTNYRRDEAHERRKPRAWRLKIDSHFHIWIGSDHIYHPGKWVKRHSRW